MASKYQREYDGYARFGRWDRAASVVVAAKAEGDPVREAEKAAAPAKQARKAAKTERPTLKVKS